MLMFSRHQTYKLVRRPSDPIPHRKIGKHLHFDVEKVLRWFDSQDGVDGNTVNQI